jgi:uncharacterized protein YggE
MSGSNEDARTRATIDVRTLVMVIAVAAALLVAYAVGASGGDTSARAAADTGAAGSADPDDTPTIVMNGTGKATPVPDQMTFRVSVHAMKSDVSSALAKTNKVVTRILHGLRGEGVNPTAVKTTGLSIHSVYDYSGTGPAVISGYSASQGLGVAVKDLSTAGDALGAAADAGGNAVRISGIKLGVSDPDAVLGQARADAVDEAKAKAQEYADATGETLGKVMSIREVTPDTYIPPVPMALDSALRAAELASKSTSVPIRAGRSSNSVTVAVVWELAD